MTALFILCLALVSVAQAETWRGVEVAPENRCSPYDRDDYPYSPAVEARILKRDGGVIRCRYTGQTFASLKGTDIEHVVALSEAHDSGLCAAPDSTRRAFAGDLANLVLAAPRVNRYEKRAKDAAEWLDGPDGGLEVFDRGLPSVGRGGGNLLTPAFAFTRENTPGRPPLVLEPDGRGRRSWAASGRWARRRRAHDDGRDRLREGAVCPMGIRGSARAAADYLLGARDVRAAARGRGGPPGGSPSGLAALGSWPQWIARLFSSAFSLASLSVTIGYEPSPRLMGFPPTRIR